jgi:galactokinase
MFETHEGLSIYYEVSCVELDMIVNTLKIEEAVIGSRLMGGGFGGCTINLIKDMKTESKTTFEALSRDFGIELKFMM